MSENALTEREWLRKHIRELRAAQGPSGVTGKSSLICVSLVQLPELLRATTIMAYAAIKQEADINSYWQGEYLRGKTIVLPRVNGDQLEAVKFNGWDQMKSGPFGLLEPEGEEFPVEKIEVALVPGVAFDLHGHRLGYGKGYYDRFLPLLNPTAFFCGIAYDLQLVNDTYPTNQDVALHAVVTESQIIRVS